MTTYVIASKHPWNERLAKRLTLKTGQNFILIQDKKELSKEKLDLINPEFVFFAHWSERIPFDVWQGFESVIFHMTDVPYGRGGSPLQNLIMRGHKTTMLSALRCVDALDAGPVYLKRPLSLIGTAEEIFCRADQVIENMIIEILNTKPVPVEQIGEPVLFKRRKPEESHLENAESINTAFDMIRMLDAKGYPHAFIETSKLKFEFKQVKRVDGQLEAKVIIHEIIPEKDV